MANRIKTLTYRRAQFLMDGIGPLEAYLIEAHNRLPNIEDRTIEKDGQVVLECRNFSVKPGVGIFIHVAAYVRGEHASVVPRLKGAATGAIQTTAPPEGCEFMDGDTMIFISGNHVILCSSALHEKQSERYLSQIIDTAKIDIHAGNFALTKIANIDKVKLLKEQGVKSVSLSSSLYGASMDYLERTTVNKSLMGGVADKVMAIFGKDVDGEELEKAENISVKIKLSFDSRKINADYGRNKLGDLANMMVEEGDDGFTIETMTGETLTHDNIVLRKKMGMPKFGKTVYCDDAWRELERYYLELKAGGLLEQ